jgi:hypothetical protein
MPRRRWKAKCEATFTSVELMHKGLSGYMYATSWESFTVAIFSACFLSKITKVAEDKRSTFF